MFNKQLDVLYVPVYMQGHWILKAIYASIYVTLYGYEERSRIAMLLVCNVLMLLLQVRRAERCEQSALGYAVVQQICLLSSLHLLRSRRFTFSRAASGVLMS